MEEPIALCTRLYPRKACCLERREDGDLIDCSRMGVGGKAIPPHIQKVSEIESDAKFILLVEKDAAFMRLAEDRFYNQVGGWAALNWAQSCSCAFRYMGAKAVAHPTCFCMARRREAESVRPTFHCAQYPCIILTAKGQPDVATRLFLKSLKQTLKIPVLALVDSDPYGLKILSVYMKGSMNMSYDSSNLTTPDIKWLGVRPRYVPPQCGADASWSVPPVRATARAKLACSALPQ